MKKTSLFLLLLTLSIILCGCMGRSNDALYGMIDEIYEGEEFTEIVELPFVSTEQLNTTYFSMDSNTASYANLRRYINSGQKISGSTIKTDELINYFSYDLPDPETGNAFSISAEIGNAPWNSDHKLLTIGIASKYVALSENIRNNIVFLIDISGSMSSDNKLPLVKQAFSKFIDSLNDEDTISIVTYASGSKIEISGEKVKNKSKILNAVNRLNASGSTNGEEGLKNAYKVAEKNFIQNGNNRVIIVSDGDFNVGISSKDDLKEYIQNKLNSGIYLSTLGFGMGNYKDTTMETLAKYGNGIYAYIDCLLEAQKVLVDELHTTMIAVAKDVKASIEFNKEYVKEYRVIGYENKQLSEDEFNNEETDAGEVGSGHTTMATYELILTEEGKMLESSFLCTVKINYKDPQNNENKTISKEFYSNSLSGISSEDFIFVGGIIEFSLLCRNSNYKASANINSVILRLESLDCVSQNAYRQEFLELVKKANNDGLMIKPIQ